MEIAVANVLAILLVYLSTAPMSRPPTACTSITNHTSGVKPWKNPLALIAGPSLCTIIITPKMHENPAITKFLNHNDEAISPNPSDDLKTFSVKVPANDDSTAAAKVAPRPIIMFFVRSLLTASAKSPPEIGPSVELESVIEFEAEPREVDEDTATKTTPTNSMPIARRLTRSMGFPNIMDAENAAKTTLSWYMTWKTAASRYPRARSVKLFCTRYTSEGKARNTTCGFRKALTTLSMTF
mmetsp:Transcript_1035/g.2510  ORF Transcript_1035/g.2510 Transcript_1035/m.2510 type:complete len:240 (-) Transcript_1035:316-1035(-)